MGSHDRGPGARETVRPGQPDARGRALLDAKTVHGGHSAYNHLLCLAQTNNLPRKRVEEVLDLVGLSEVAGRRSKGFSLGEAYRVGVPPLR